MLSCLWVPHFAAAVERLHNPPLRGAPLLLLSGGRVQHVIAADALAARVGVTPKMSLRHARMLTPDAQTVTAREAAYQRVAGDLAELLLGFANRAELDAQSTDAAFFIAADADTAAPALNALVDALGAPVHCGIAANKLTAHIAAVRGGDTLTRVPAGDEAAFLAPHPVTLLPLDKAMARRLPLLGIHTLGQYAALPRLAAWEQFGLHGRWLHDLANGMDPRPLEPYLPPQRLSLRHGFEPPIHERGPLEAVLGRLAAQLGERLAGQSAARMTLLLRLSDGTLTEASTQPAEPITAAPLRITRRALDLLAQIVVAAPVETVTLRLDDVQAPQPRQLSLFEHMAAQRHLKTLVPRWMRRHPQTAFYYGEVHSESPHALPEDRAGLREERGA